VAETRVLALDIGSSSVRARLHDEDAAPLGDEARRSYTPLPDGELDPVAVRDAALAVEEEARRDRPPVEAVGTSCFWHSLLALDERDRPLTAILTWRDVRSASQARVLATQVDPIAAYRRTGAPLHASFWPAKLAWLAAERPQAFRSARRFVAFADWLLLEQTGELRTSVSMASGTGLLAGGSWDAELLDVLAIDPKQLPPLDDEAVGDRYPALGDGACSNLGSGCAGPGRIALNLGTSAAMRVVATDDEPPPPGLFRYRVDAERALVGGSVSAGASLLRWLSATLRTDAGASLADRPAAAHGLSFLPHLAGERSPGWNDEATGAVVGLTFDTSPLDIAQAAVEGLALELRRVAELLPPTGELVVSGGLARNDDVLQIVADVLERELLVSAEPEASARGAAVAVLERLGRRPPDPGVAHLVRPRGERVEAYRSAMTRHLRLMRGVT
jgi:gluconokinase